MVYTAGVPNALDAINQTQAKIKDNFGEIKTSIEMDHAAFGAATQGKHTALHLTKVTSPATTATEWGMFVKNDGAGNPQVFMTPPGSTPAGTLADIQLTSGAVGSGAGWVALLGGIKLQYGSAIAPSGSFPSPGLVTVTYPLVFSSACYGFFITCESAGPSQAYYDMNVVGGYGVVSTVVHNNQSGARTFYWVAIGK